MRAAILGAYGAVGSRIATAAAARRHVVTAVGRDPNRLALIPADHHVTLAAGDAVGLARVARDQDVLINASGVEDIELARTSTAAGA